MYNVLYSGNVANKDTLCRKEEKKIYNRQCFFLYYLLAMQKCSIFFNNIQHFSLFLKNFLYICIL